MGDIARHGRIERHHSGRGENGRGLVEGGKADAEYTEGVSEALRNCRRSRPVCCRNGVPGIFHDRLWSFVPYVGEISPASNKNLQICFYHPFIELGEFSPKTLFPRRIFALWGEYENISTQRTRKRSKHPIRHIQP